jgi:anti-sigma factor ChrR (cupin superfamily)
VDTAEFNADPNKLVVMNTAEMPWQETDPPGVRQKLLERVIDSAKGRETALIKLDPGVELPAETLADRWDVFTLEGRYSDGHGMHEPRTFIMSPPGEVVTLSSDIGCVFYRKMRRPFRDDTAKLLIDTNAVEWTPFPQRGARVVHFYRDPHGIEFCRFGEVFAEQHIPKHDHAIGEETLIVEGALKDEYDVYPAGTWLRFPILLPHEPCTESESCYMFIRDGDLVW